MHTLNSNNSSVGYNFNISLTINGDYMNISGPYPPPKSPKANLTQITNTYSSNLL